MSDEKLKLGDFEGVILMAVHAMGENAYGVTIRQESDRLLKRTVAIGAVYTTLDRLLEKGFVRTWEGEPEPTRGGRRKRFYAVEGTGLRALELKALDAQEKARLWAPGTLAGGAA